MRELIRPGTLMMLAVGLTGTALAWTGWIRTVGAARQERPVRGSVLVAAPGEKAHILEERMRAKNRVVGRLIEGEMSLVEAGAWFRYVNDHPQECPSNFRREFAGRSEGEKACRQVIAWVRARLEMKMTASQVDLVLCRLRGELDTLLAEEGTVELPW